MNGVYSRLRGPLLRRPVLYRPVLQLNYGCLSRISAPQGVCRRQNEELCSLLLGQSWRRHGTRWLSSSEKDSDASKDGTEKKGPTDDSKKDPEDDDDDDIQNYTPSEMLSAGFWAMVYLAGFGLAATCLYLIGKELFPSRMNPYSIFNRALEDVKADLHVTSKFGEPIKGFGKDSGDRREGRRRFLEHYEFDNPRDGSKRVRVRFNIEGPHGRAVVHAEVSNKTTQKWVYLMVEDIRDGSVVVIEDNRAKIELASGTSNEADNSIFGSLLAGGKDSSK